MFRILIAVDGSESSDRAIAHLIGLLGWYKEKPEVHLLNVQHSLPDAVGRFVAEDQLRGFHREQGDKALASARRALDSAQVPYAIHIGVGDPAHVIAHYAKEKGIDQIVMGTRGLGTVAGLVMGSVTTHVMSLTGVPVLLVK